MVSIMKRNWLNKIVTYVIGTLVQGIFIQNFMTPFKEINRRTHASFAKIISVGPYFILVMTKKDKEKLGKKLAVDLQVLCIP